MAAIVADRPFVSFIAFHPFELTVSAKRALGRYYGRMSELDVGVRPLGARRIAMFPGWKGSPSSFYACDARMDVPV
jgi:hypothetical protein